MNLKGWRTDMENAPEDGPVVYGYWSNFDRFVWTIHHSASAARKYGFTHWMVPPIPERA